MPAVNIDGLKVDYEDEGTGLPVVFIPGITGSKDWFKYQLSGLSKRHRIISYNLRKASRRERYTIDLLTEDLARFIHTTRLVNAVIAGHCFGGLVAQQFALKYPQQASALILSSTFPHLPPHSPQQIIDMLAPGPIQFESSISRFFRKLFGGRRQIADDVEGLDWLAKHNAALDRATLDARIRIVEQFDSRSRLPEITVPTLVIVGAEDNALILAGAQQLDEGISQANLEVIEGGDHFMFYTRHDLYNDVVDDFLMSHLAELS